MIARLVFLAVLALALPARAAVTLSNFPPNPGVLPGGGWTFTPGTTFADPTPARAWVNGVYGGVPAAVVTDTFALKGPAGNLSVAVSTAATAASIAGRLASLAVRVNTVGAVLSAGSLAYDLLASYGVRQGASGAEVDPGSAPGTRNGCSVSGISAASDVAACAAYKISLGNPGYTQVNEGGYLVSKPKTYKDTVSTYNGPYGNRLYCKIEIFDYLGVLSYPNFRQEIITNSSVADSCTESATGAIMTMRADGKCPTGRYESATESQVSSRMLPAAQANPSNAAKAVLSAGQSVDSSPYSVTGPASQIGSANTTTTTGPTGTTATTKTPTYSYNYAGNTVTYNTTNSTVTNITNNTGGTSTTTTIEQVPASDNKQLCDAYPDSLACLKPGTVPDAEAVPIQRKQFSIVPDTSRWAPNAGACTRGAIQLSTGVTINIWKPFCDFFALIRGVVIGMFGLVGALIFKNGIK